jgi:hypothetical protein
VSSPPAETPASLPETASYRTEGCAAPSRLPVPAQTQRKALLEMNDFPLTGGCNGGAVRFEVTEPLVVASYWRCKRCQRRSGAAGSANAHPAPGPFRIVAGEDRLRVWKPDDGGEKWFWGRLWLVALWPQSQSRRSDRHPHGAFDGEPGLRPSVRQFVAYAAPWEPIPDDGMPRYPESRHTPRCHTPRDTRELGAHDKRARQPALSSHVLWTSRDGLEPSVGQRDRPI